MFSFSALLRMVATTVAFLLMTTTIDIHHPFAQALDADEYQPAKVVGGAIGRHSARHIRSGRTKNMKLEGNRQQDSRGAEYIPGRRLGKTLHIGIHNERHEVAENSS